MRRFSLALLLLLLPLSLFAQSQATTGVIEGTAVDPSGAALPGVTVTVHNTATGLTRDGVAAGDGHFMIAGLPPGDYTVDAGAGT